MSLVVFLVNTLKICLERVHQNAFKYLASSSTTCQDTVSYIPFKGLQMKGKAVIDNKDMCQLHRSGKNIKLGLQSGSDAYCLGDLEQVP